MDAKELGPPPVSKRVPSKEARLKWVSQVHRREVNIRRRYEWRTITAALAFFVLGAAASLKSGAPRPTEFWERLTVWVLWLGLAFAAIAYIRGLLKANEFNRSMAHAAENELIRQLKVPALTALISSDNTRTPHWALFPSAAILLSAAVSALVVTAELPQTKIGNTATSPHSNPTAPSSGK